MSMILGINNISNSEYHKCKNFISSSGYKTLLEDPAKFYKENILGQREAQEEKAHLQFGSLLHSLVLEPDTIDQEYAVFDGLSRRGAAYESFKTANEGKQIVTKGSMMEAQRLVKAVKRSTAAQSLLKLGGFSEHTVAVDLNGIPTKARADKIIPEAGIIWDLKTSAFSLDPDSARMTVKHWKYELSAALYCEVFAAHYGRPFDFLWVFVNKAEADVAVYKMSEATRMAGLQQISKAAKIYKQCMATGIWQAPEPKLHLDEEILEL